MRLVDTYEVELLIDLWSKDSAIWKLSINLESLVNSIKLIKLRNYHNYAGKPYSDKVEW